MSEYLFLHGDSNKIIPQLNGRKFNLIVTSPPYNVGKEYEKSIDFKKYQAEQKKIASFLVDRLADNGSLCWQVGTTKVNGELFPLDIFFYDVFKSLGLTLRNRIVWHYRHGLHASMGFSGRYETILWFTKGNDYTFNLDDVRVKSRYPGKRHYKGSKKGQLSSNSLGKNPSDVWAISEEQWEIIEEDWVQGVWDVPNVKANHREKTIHPCQFPIELVERLILALTAKGDWVLDPFAGVGSAILASLKHERNAIGIEKYKKYLKIGEQRIEALFEGELKQREISKVYDPSLSPLSSVDYLSEVRANLS